MLSRLAFVWVNPLIKKGVAGYLRRIDDLFMLPACLDVTAISDRMRACLVASGRLFGALHRAHGVEFYGIGALRLVSDMAGFAGPLLLGGLLSHSVAPADDVEGGFDERESDWQAYLYALGLFASSLIGKCCFFLSFGYELPDTEQFSVILKSFKLPSRAPTSIGA